MDFNMRTSLLFSAVLFCTTSLYAQVEDFSGVDFKKADSIAGLYPGHALSDLKLLSDKLTTTLSTDVEKFRAIYRWVCNNIDNDYTLYSRNKHKREKLKDADELKKWNTKISVKVFQTLLEKHRTVCTGYAYLVKELAHHARIPAEIIDGYGRTAVSNIGGAGIPNHTWNAVRFGNKWYLCDATWSSGAIDIDKGVFVKTYNDSYFLLEPSLFIRNHYPLDTAWILMDHKPTLETFLHRPLIYSAIFPFKIDQLFPDTFAITTPRRQPVAFRFTKQSARPVENVELIIDGRTETVKAGLYKDVDGLYCIDHTFRSKGKHVVHILFDGNHAFTYTVKVI